MMTAMKWFYAFLKKYRLRMFFGMVLVTILAAGGPGESLYLQDYSRYRDQRRKDRISDSACRDPCRACSRKGGMPV